MRDPSRGLGWAPGKTRSRCTDCVRRAYGQGDEAGTRNAWGGGEEQEEKPGQQEGMINEGGRRRPLLLGSQLS